MKMLMVVDTSLLPLSTKINISQYNRIDRIHLVKSSRYSSGIFGPMGISWTFLQSQLGHLLSFFSHTCVKIKYVNFLVSQILYNSVCQLCHYVCMSQTQNMLVNRSIDSSILYWSDRFLFFHFLIGTFQVGK